MYDPTIFRLAIERANHCTVLEMFQARQKDIMRVDSGLRDCGESFSKSRVKCI